MYTRFFKLAVLVLALGMLCALTACQNNMVSPDQFGTADTTLKQRAEYVTVVVQDRYSGQPRPGIKVAVMDAANNLLRAMPARTDSDGQVTFSGLPSGHYAVVVFTGADFGVYNLPGSFHLPLAPDEKWPIGLAIGHQYPQNDSSLRPTQAHDFYVQTYNRSQPGGLPRIQGMMVDAVTGEPIGGAFVSLTPNFSAYLGHMRVWDDVTLADGLFSVSDIPFAQDPQSGDVFQVVPLMVMCEGYLPRPYLHQLASGDDNLDITDAIIEMSPEDNSGSGTLAGTLVFDGEPVPDLVVGLCYFGPLPGPAKSNVGLPGKIAVTDENGYFQFDDLLPGGYFPFPAFLPDSRYQFYDPDHNYIHAVYADQTIDMGSVSLVRTMRQIYPAPSAIYNNPVTVFNWTTIDDADNYSIYLDYMLIGTSTTGYFELPAGEEILAGQHLWTVAAQNRDGVTIGLTKRSAYFTVQ